MCDTSSLPSGPLAARRKCGFKFNATPNVAEGEGEPFCTDARDADSDNDGRLDGAEDNDGDGVNNEHEFQTHNDAHNPDSDFDEVSDGDEERD